MDRTIILSAAIVAGLAVNSNAAEYASDLVGFKKVDAGNGVVVEISVGGSYAVNAHSESDESLSRLRLHMRGDTLEVYRERSSQISWGLAQFIKKRSDPVYVSVSMPDLDGVTTHSGADVLATGNLGNDLVLRASSGSDLTAKGATGDRVWLSASSGANLNVEGGCNAVTIDASSGADIDARSLVCSTVVAHASSGADIVAHAEAKVVAKASSGADVEVFGQPSDHSIQTSSAADIHLVN